MEFNLELLQSPTTQAAIAAFAIATTQLIKHRITVNRKFWIPFTSFIIGIIAAIVVGIIPKEFIPVITTVGTLITGTGGVGLAQETAKKASPTTETLEPPVIYNS